LTPEDYARNFLKWKRFIEQNGKLNHAEKFSTSERKLVDAEVISIETFPYKGKTNA
jgi:alkylated DNA nucleotide flippase Atl1